MTIKIFKESGTAPIGVWDNYPCVPNIGDNVYIPGFGLKIVVYRVFRANEVHIRVE